MRIVMAIPTGTDGDDLRRILLGEGLNCTADDIVTYDALPARLATVNPQLVLVQMDTSGTDALAAIRAAVHVTDAPILAAGPATDTGLTRSAIEAGAREFLDSARLREELTAAVLKIGVEKQGREKAGTIVALFSPSGGVGVSNIAANLTARLAKDLNNKVALIDLKPAPSDLCLLLDIEPLHTTNDVLECWQRLDRQLLAGAMTQHRSGACVLAQQSYPDGGGIPDNFVTRSAVRQLLVLLRRMHQVSILDLAHTLDESQIEAMMLSNFVGLVVRPDVTGLRRAAWALDTAGKLGVARDRFRLMLSRSGSGQVGAKQAVEALGIELMHTFPDAGAVVNKAVNRGVTVGELSRLSRISRSFSSLARQVENFSDSIN